VTASPRTINKISLEDQAVDLIREQILEGVIQPGERLVESRLAKDYALSRGTVRIALQRLGNEGLIEQRPYVGWRVVEFTEQDIWELYTLRVALESMASRLAAQRITPAGKQRLLDAFETLEALCRTGSIERITQADLGLHLAIVELAEHARLKKQYDLIQNQFLLYIKTSNRDFRVDTIAESHRELIEAICAGDAARAEQEAIRNITELGPMNSAP